jgi:hypothetical protein
MKTMEHRFLGECEPLGAATDETLSVAGKHIVDGVKVLGYEMQEAMDKGMAAVRKQISQEVLRLVFAKYRGPYKEAMLLPSLGIYALQGAPEVPPLVEELVVEACRSRWGMVTYANTVKRMLGKFSVDSQVGGLCLEKEDVQPFVEAAVVAVESERLEVQWLCLKEEAEKRIHEHPLYSSMGDMRVNLLRGTLVSGTEGAQVPPCLDEDVQAAMVLNDILENL